MMFKWFSRRTGVSPREVIAEPQADLLRTVRDYVATWPLVDAADTDYGKGWNDATRAFLEYLDSQITERGQS